MNDAELAKTFPYGAMVIPRAENEMSFKAKVGDDYEEDPSFFTVWDSPHHSTELSRELSPINDGWETKSAHDKRTYFLRPLSEETGVDF